MPAMKKTIISLTALAMFVSAATLLSEGVTDEAVEYALFTGPADLGHAFLPFTHADGKKSEAKRS